MRFRGDRPEGEVDRADTEERGDFGEAGESKPVGRTSGGKVSLVLKLGGRCGLDWVNVMAEVG